MGSAPVFACSVPLPSFLLLRFSFFSMKESWARKDALSNGIGDGAENGAGAGLKTSGLVPSFFSDVLNGSTNAVVLIKVGVNCASVVFFSVGELELSSSTAASFFAADGHGCLHRSHFPHVCEHSLVVCFHTPNRSA